MGTGAKTGIKVSGTGAAAMIQAVPAGITDLLEESVITKGRSLPSNLSGTAGSTAKHSRSWVLGRTDEK